MTPDRFQQMELLYHSVREAGPGERESLLADADAELRLEVESLLSQQISGEFLDRPAVHSTQDLLQNATGDGLAAGTCLGPYRVESKLGEGGMGKVFRAIDTRLGRAVAIKTMREQFSSRFEREARAISSLNHQNICTLFDVGPDYLVMELLEGETIADQLQTGPIPKKSALSYAFQIAAALKEAHAKGIIHCDLKPGNIMIVNSRVKVLDFGLANSIRDENVTLNQTVIGTPAYMAPEQKEGKAVDARTDIYAFGCVLHELLNGGRAETAPHRIRSRRLERIVHRCLDENPERRWQTVAELERELGAVASANRHWYSTAAVATVLIAFATAYAYLHRAPQLGKEDTILLAEFENKTGDPVFDGTLRQGLIVELGQSPFLSLVPDSRVQRVLTLMGQPKGVRLSPEIAEQVCQRVGSTVVLTGSIASLGPRYVLDLRAKTCNIGRILDQEQVAATREDLLNAISQIARKLRRHVGESQATVEKHSVPLAEATTASLEALKAYTSGVQAVLYSGTSAGLPFLQRAVEIDPKFAMAHAVLGLLYSAVGESVLSVESTTKAWRLRDRVSDREKFFIDFTYDRQVTGNLENAYQTLELWLQTYPRGEQPNPQSLLGGLSTHGTGRFEKAIEATQASIAADPDFSLAYATLASSYLLTDRFPEAVQTIERASTRKLEMPDFLVIRYIIATIKGENNQMDQAVHLARGMRRAEHWVAHAEALASVRSGRLEDARQSESRAMDLALQEGEHEAAASYRSARAVWESLCGYAAEARKSATAALELSHGRDVTYTVGFALALSGGFSRTTALAADLEKRFPQDTFVRFTYLPVLRAYSALGRNQSSEAVELLQTAIRYEWAVNGLNFAHFYLGGLHSAYVRGEALLAAHRYPEAAVEFQKILDHRGLVGLDPIGTFAYWRLGRAYALAGDKTRAKAAYGRFLKLWEHADSDIPILKRVKAENAGL